MNMISLLYVDYGCLRSTRIQSLYAALFMTSLWYAASSTGVISEEGGFLARYIASHAATFQAASFKSTAESNACQMP